MNGPSWSIVLLCAWYCLLGQTHTGLFYSAPTEHLVDKFDLQDISRYSVSKMLRAGNRQSKSPIHSETQWSRLSIYAPAPTFIESNRQGATALLSDIPHSPRHSATKSLLWYFIERTTVRQIPITSATLPLLVLFCSFVECDSSLFRTKQNFWLFPCLERGDAPGIMKLCSSCMQKPWTESWVLVCRRDTAYG